MCWLTTKPKPTDDKSVKNIPGYLGAPNKGAFAWWLGLITENGLNRSDIIREKCSKKKPNINTNKNIKNTK